MRCLTKIVGMLYYYLEVTGSKTTAAVARKEALMKALRARREAAN